MNIFLPLIPLAVLVVLWGLILRRGWSLTWAGAFLRALVVWALVACWMIEILSPLEAITPIGLGAGWLSVGIIAAILWVQTPWDKRKALNPKFQFPHSHIDRFSFGLILVVLLITAVVAWLSPPQTWDSLNYHMPRVAHWAQQRSVEHFATGIEVQNSRPPGAEYLLLQGYVLSAGDRILPLTNWFFFVASILSAFVIAGRFNRRARWVSAAVLAMVPMAIIQASGTVNDIAVGLWVMVFSWEILQIDQGYERPINFMFLGGPAGLALLTKPTAFAYILPLSLWATYKLLRSSRLRYLIPGIFVMILVVVSLNGPYMFRNQQTYGSPFSMSQVEIHSNQIRSPAALVSNVLRNMALHASTPIPELNKAVFLTVVKVHDLMGLSQNDPRTTAHEPFRVHSFSTHEERSGNVLHAALIIATAIWVFVNRQRLPSGVLGIALSSVAAFFLLSSLFQWQVFASRYHLPIFMPWAPILGVFIATIPTWQRATILVVLFVGSIPWLISIRSRPLIPIPGEVSAPSVLTGSRQTLYYTNGEYLEPVYTSLTSQINEQGCRVVGIAISGASPEYLLWVELGAPDQDLQIEWIVADTPSARYQPPDFEPCAVICEDCAPEQASIRTLPAVDRLGGYSLFLNGAE